jgi:hypothetical protein
MPDRPLSPFGIAASPSFCSIPGACCAYGATLPEDEGTGGCGLTGGCGSLTMTADPLPALLGVGCARVEGVAAAGMGGGGGAWLACAEAAADAAASGCACTAAVYAALDECDLQAWDGREGAVCRRHPHALQQLRHLRSNVILGHLAAAFCIQYCTIFQAAKIPPQQKQYPPLGLAIERPLTVPQNHHLRRPAMCRWEATQR